MGFRSKKTAKMGLSVKEIFAAVPDELLGSVISLAIQSGGGVLIGQNRGKTALSVTLYEPNDKNPPQYCNTADEAFILFTEMYDYLKKNVDAAKNA